VPAASSPALPRVLTPAPTVPPPAPAVARATPPLSTRPAETVAPVIPRPSPPSTRPAETSAAAAPRRSPPSNPVRRAPSPEPVPSVVAPPSPPAAPAEDHFGLALYYQRVADFDNALAHYRALLEQNDASAEVHNNLGLLYEEHGQRDDAVKQFQPYDRVQEPLPSLRKDLVRLVSEAHRRRVEAFILANNRAEGNAPGTIKAVARMWQEAV